MPTSNERFRQATVVVALVTVLAQMILFLVSVPGYKIGVDEAWLGEQAYFLSHDGAVKESMPIRIDDQPRETNVYHKLTIWLGSLVMGMFGLNLFALRMIVIIAGSLLLFFIFRYSSRYTGHKKGEHWILLAVLLGTPVLWDRWHYFRPEFLVALFGFLSYFALSQFIAKRQTSWAAVAGLLAGLAVLSHLNGLIFVLATAIMLLVRKQFGALILFGLCAAVVSSLYAVGSFDDLGGLWYQLSHTANGDPRDLGFMSLISNLLDEHKRLFRSPMIAGMTILYLISLIDTIRTRRFFADPINLFTVLLIFLLGVLANHKTEKYAILLFPFMALSIMQMYHELTKSRSSNQPVLMFLFGLLLFVHLGIGLGYNFNNTVNGREYAESRHAEVAAKLKPGASVVAPMKFMYNQYNHFNIWGYEGIQTEILERKRKFRFSSLRRRAAAERIEYILIDTRFDDGWYPGFKEDGVPAWPEYKDIGTVAGYKILELLPPGAK